MNMRMFSGGITTNTPFLRIKIIGTITSVLTSPGGICPVRKLKHITRLYPGKGIGSFRKNSDDLFITYFFV